MFIVISTTDIREHVAFNIHCYILAIMGIAYNVGNFGNLYQEHAIIASVLGLILGAGLIALYFGLGYLLLKTMVIGPGDIFIAGALGACFGWKYILYILASAVAIQVIAFLPVFFIKLIKKKDYITILEFIFFTIVAASTYYINNIYMTILLVITGIILCKRILDTLPANLVELNDAMLNGESDNKTFEEKEFFHLPFGPALCCAALLFIFLH